MAGSSGSIPLQTLQAITEQLDNANSNEERDQILDAVRENYGDEAAQEAAEVFEFGNDSSPVEATVRSMLDTIWETELDAQGDLDFVGTTIGAYRIAELIGRGGGGTVFRAERSDEQFERSVALKILRGEAPQLREEVKLHGDLEHDAIARLYDAGRTPDGRSYIVMEFVEGIPLHKFLETASLQTSLGTFEAVCNAISYVHARGLLHLDLKPSNILVTPEGKPKVLDFGIGQRLGPMTKPKGLTDYYASPEQRYGQVVSVTSDIYSLGVLLRDILGDNAPPPLQAVVSKATKFEASQRHQAVEELLGDIVSYRRKRPISAYNTTLTPPAAFAYRGQLFLTRNRYSTISVVVLAALLVTFLAYQGQARRASSVTDAYLETTEALTTWLDPQALDEGGLTRVDLFNREVTKARRQFRNDSRRLANQLTIYGNGYANIGFLSTGLELQNEAVDLLSDGRLRPEEEARIRLNYAAALLENSLVVECDEQMSLARPIVEASDDAELRLGYLRVLAQLYRDSDRGEQAEAVALEAVELAERSFEPGHRDIIYTLDHLASVYRSEGRTELALQTYRANLEARRQNAQDRDIRMAENHNAVAVLLGEMFRSSQDTTLLTEALQHMDQAIMISTIRQAQGHPILANAHHTKGNMLARLGRYQEAAESHAESVRIYSRYLGTDHPLLPSPLEAFGQAQFALNNFNQGEISYTDAIDISERLERFDDAAQLATQLALMLRRVGQSDRALPHAKKALDHYAETQRGGSQWQGNAALYGAILAELDRYTEARPYLEEVWLMRSTSLPETNWRRGTSASLLGYVLAKLGEEERGIELMTYARDQLLSERGPDDPNTRDAIRYLEEFQ